MLGSGACWKRPCEQANDRQRHFLAVTRKLTPRSRGGKLGPKYGRRCRRPIPEQVDEVIDVPLPDQGPQCGSGLEETGVIEIPQPRVERIEFRIHQGCCKSCGQPVEARHPPADLAGGHRKLTIGTTGCGSGHAIE